MVKGFTVLVAAGALALTVVTTASILAPDAQAQSKLEERATKYRQAVMVGLSWHLGSLVAVAKGEKEFDSKSVAYHATSLSDLSDMSLEGFAVVTGPSGDAEAAIWEDFADFTAKSDALAKEAEAFAKAAPNMKQDELGGYIQKVGGTCKACHDSYRK